MADRTSPEGAATGRLARLLVAAAVGVYLLVVAGAATALLSGGCGAWPTCGGGLLPSPEPATLAAWSHRVATLAVGGLLAATAWVAHRRGASRRVRFALVAALALYPGQIALGALVATGPSTTALASAHLVAGMAIFVAVAAALLWHLEAVAAGARVVVDRPGGTDVGRRGDAAVAGTGDMAPGTSPDAATEATTDAEPADGPVAVADQMADRPLRTTLGAYLELTKPRLWWLLCLVAVAAMAMAAGPSLAPATVLATLAGGVLAIAASGTFNNVLERDVDRRMDRTSGRPLVEGRVPPWRAAVFGLGLAAASVGTFLAFVNALAAALGLLAILFYSVGYTVVLKPNTDQNIVVGGAVGAFPALIGWAAVTDAVGLPAVVLGGVVFLWTPAHFYNLALAHREDYARAGFPMLPVVRGAATTRRHVLGYLVATMLAAVALGTAGRLGWLYAAAVVAVGAAFLWAVVRQYHEPTERVVLRTFHASNAYLGVLLVAVALDSLLV